ncbi:sugar ABC transporter permease [Corallococcus sp. AB032C]|uniref:carbohydrate ABC transporter permease n=1 Tax=Corallococcus TaxID=83461 RepID=UPI000ECCE28C|nr:sugar ABC transporter permease [Corallococcus sp. AB032C]NPC46159.1 sugar ABC transporter permease [Corallococcus exiguus]RKH81712.1 sugar ABC transporter permease [Corallococcus sp. AB032C]
MSQNAPQQPPSAAGAPTPVSTSPSDSVKDPSTPGPSGRAGGYRGRVLVGLALALGVSLFLAHGLLARANQERAAEREQRTATVSLLGLTDLVQRAGGTGDGVKAVVTGWPGVPGSSVRVIAFSGIKLEASTFPDDTGDKAAPRRLSREEKPLYDRGQRLRAAVETNREEGSARKAEVESELLDNGASRLLSVPVEVDGQVVGSVESLTPAVVKGETPSWTPVLLAFLLPLAACAAAVFALSRQGARVAVAAALFLAGLGGYTVYSLRALDAELRQTEDAVSAELRTRGEKAQALIAANTLNAEPALKPGAWDADAMRRPLGKLTESGAPDEAKLSAAGAQVRGNASKALGALGVVGLAVLLFIGLGALHRAVATAVEFRQAYAYIMPAMVGMVVLVFFPFAYGITLSFTDANLYNSSQPLSELWVGFRNYVDILGDFSFAKTAADGSLVFNYLNFYYTLLFTIVWTVTNVTIGVTVGLLLALALNVPNLRMRPVYRVLLILPWAMPNYITALIWKGMFHQQFGVVNHVIRMFGGDGLAWFDSPLTSFFTALATNGWLSFPFMMVVSLGALQSIPGELYEAARVDGANRWQQFTAITLPALKPALVPAVILSVVWTFNMFNIIFLVTGGDPGGSTEILVTQAYKFAFERYRHGYAAAYSTVIFGILLLYSMVQNRMSRATEAA